MHLPLNTCFFQELRSREEELTRAALQQKSQEELLKRREQQLAEREINVLERELNILIFQLNKDKPNVKKRKGKFKRSRLKLKDGNRISLPSGELADWTKLKYSHIQTSRYKWAFLFSPVIALKKIGLQCFKTGVLALDGSSLSLCAITQWYKQSEICPAHCLSKLWS